MQLGLLLVYPLLAHLAVMRHSAELAGVALVLLAVALLLPALRRRSASAWLALVAIAGTLGALAWTDRIDFALYVPPLAFQAAILWLFASSLAGARTPLVTQIATASWVDLPPELVPYTRRVTWAWSIVLALQLAVTLTLQLGGLREAWSLFTNFISYGLLALVFVAEYLYRRRRFPHLPHHPLLAHLRLVLRHRPRPA
jgi:uncharacterized membrane protein